MRIVLAISLLLTLPSGLLPQSKAATNVWEPFKFFVGNWEGSGKGQPGVSKIQREYRMVLGDKFLQVQNTSTYEPQPKNPKGEVHRDWGMIGFDKVRKNFVFRQFHIESFVIQSVMSSSSADGKTIVFTSESIENIPAGFRARETYKIMGPDEFIEVFEIAETGKEFELYSEGHLRRKK
ncbi:MAG: hypothetical protein ABI596_00725 [Pyrinomonadaceae bacterium]